MSALEWSEADPKGVSYMSINTSFIGHMKGPICASHTTDSWGREMTCLRLPGHTGRHLDTERLCRYPIAVWS